jgi:hypothetical protein
MKGGTLYARVIPADRDRGFNILFSWEKPVIQRTCQQMSSISAITRKSLEISLSQALERYGVDQVIDVTDAGIKKRLEKMFQEQSPVIPMIVPN